MMPRQAYLKQDETWDARQDRIARLKQEKSRLLDEWSQAMKRAYHVPVPYRHDVLLAVGKRYSTLVDAIESHITTLKTSIGEFLPRMEHLLLRTGRYGM
jgi:hypothetical protein